MIQIAPLPVPRKPAAPLPPLVLKPSLGRTPVSRWLRSTAPKPVRKPQ